MKGHLAIFKGNGGELILEGKKSIESRFSKRKDPPFAAVAPGDLVYIKPTGAEIIGQFRVKKVIFYDGLETGDIRDIKEKYNDQIQGPSEYWMKNQSSRYGSLIFIGNSSRFITAPIKIPKKDHRGWVVLG